VKSSIDLAAAGRASGAGVAMADFRVVAERTALVNVDLQNLFVERPPGVPID
jgi:hypothetical protein